MGEIAADRWIEVDLDALTENLHSINRFLADRTRLIAVVKANAYGMGAVEVAHTLSQQGVDFFAATFVEEALEMRRGGIDNDILVFAPVRSDQAEKAVNNNLTLTIASFHDYKVLSTAAFRLRRRTRVHLKVDTGLGRFGIEEEGVLELAELVNDDDYLVLEGVYTHFAEAGAHSSRYTWKQFRRFQGVLQILDQAGIRISLRHCCNSAAALKFPEMHLDAVRIGTLLGGQYPAGDVPKPILLHNPYRFKARVAAVRDLPAGCYLGYYRTYRTRAPVRVAVVAAGFKDGLGMEAFSRPGSLLDLLKILARLVLTYLNFSRFAMKVTLRGQSYWVRGKVFMQFCMVEFPPGSNIVAGDVVEVPVKRTMAAADVSRVFLKNGQPVKIELNERRLSYTGKGGTI
ncbi:MAG: alanine racemase [Syntrophomonadaceae bacterium]|jgi:alanine racemase|nr:alanine racemase [Syntrophomonadaceae bacterium]